MDLCYIYVPRAETWINRCSEALIRLWCSLSTSLKNWAWNISQEEHQAFHTLFIRGSFCVLQLLSDQYGFYLFLIHSFPSLVPRDALLRLCFPATEERRKKKKKTKALWNSDQHSHIILEIWASLNDSLLYLPFLKGEMTPSLQAKLFRAIRFWCCPSNPSCQDGTLQIMVAMGRSFSCRTNICTTRSATAASTAARAKGGCSWTHATLRPSASSGCLRGPTPPCWSTSTRATTEAPRAGRVPRRSRSNENLSAGHKRSFSAIPLKVSFQWTELASLQRR